MSRFYIRQREAEFPLSQLPNRVTCWTSINKEIIIVFDCSGNYVVWDFQEERGTHRGTIPETRSVKMLKENVVVCVSATFAVVYDYEKKETMARLPLDGFRFIDSLEPNKEGFTMVSSNMDGLKRFNVYNGGEAWEVSKQVNLSRSWLVVDSLAQGIITNFQQYVTASDPVRDFMFGVWHESKGMVMETIALTQEIPMTIIKIVKVSDSSYLIVGNSNEAPTATAYLISIDEENMKNVEGPIKLSRTPLIDVVFFESHSNQLVFITQAPHSQKYPEDCPLDAPQKCKISVQVFNLTSRIHQNVKHFSDYSQISHVHSHNAFIMRQADSMKKPQKTIKFRLVKIINQYVQYIHLMKHLKIDEKYGKQMLTSVLNLLRL